MIRTGALQIHDSLEPLLDDIAALKPYRRNPRAGDVDAIVESMRVNGMYRPVYAWRETGEVLAGNHTYAAALSLGAERIPVVWLDVDAATAKKVVLADNRTADLGTYDNAALVDLLTELAKDDTIEGTGYDDQALKQLELLIQQPFEPDDFGQWPTVSFTVHPRVRAAFKEATDEAGTDDERFLLLLQMADISW